MIMGIILRDQVRNINIRREYGVMVIEKSVKDVNTGETTLIAYIMKYSPASKLPFTQHLT